MDERLKKILHGLNDAQREAVETTRGPLAILAGAGTGKTTTITRRIAFQIATEAFEPRQILAVAFSKKAVTEMGSRLQSLDVSGVRVMTFHGEALFQFRRFVDADTKLIMKKGQILFPLAKKLPPPYRFRALRDLATEIEWAKNRRISAKDYPDAVGDHRTPIPVEHMTEIYRGYQREVRRQKSMDFEDLFERLLQHLSGNDRDLGIIRGRYRAFTVDEYQDVNLLQESLLRQWLGVRDDMCVVGDDYQSIYGFTGATPKHLLGFGDRFDRALETQLVENYRSTPQILETANRLVPKLEGTGKRLKALRPAGAPVQIRRFASAEDEVEAIVSRIQTLMEQGTPAHEIAILLRINARTEPFEEALSAAHIRYQVRDGSFLSREAARSFLGAIRRVRPDVAPRDAVLAVTDELGYQETASDDLADEEATRQQDLARLRTFAESTSATTVSGFVDELKARFASDEDGVGVVLMTYHRSKGLEFDAVFLPRLEIGELPIRHAKAPEEIAEERRLFYVGITRARLHLWVSMAKFRPEERRGRMEASQFLDEIDPKAEPKAVSGRKVRQEDSDVAQIDADPLFQRLRQWRLETAKEAQLPAYIVFADATLRDIVRRRPNDRDGLKAISGIGPLKMRRYGDDILGILAEFRAA